MRRVIVVIGEALIDLLVRPDGRVEAAPGGGPFNTARTIARLGQRVAFAGRLSTDAFGRRLRDALAADEVDLDLVDSTDDPTTLAVVEAGAAKAAEYRFYLDGTSAPGLGPAVVERIDTPSALHVGTLGLVLEPLGSTVELAVGIVEVDIERALARFAVLGPVEVRLARPVTLASCNGTTPRTDAGGGEMASAVPRSLSRLTRHRCPALHG